MDFRNGPLTSRCARAVIVYTVMLVVTAIVPADEVVLDRGTHHLRIGPTREWTDFPETSEGSELVVGFSAAVNPREQTLRLRHRDVKQSWKLSLNGRDLGTLPLDENDMVSLWSVPAGSLRAGPNELRIVGASRTGDDIEVGDIRLVDRPRSEVLAEATVEASVVDAGSGAALPCRLTIVDDNGSLIPLGIASDERHAVRAGVVYAAEGHARFGLPAGNYKVYAGRGFEYGVAVERVEVAAGRTATVRLAIRREVPTEGFVACDTHVHTVTHSGHGDATLAERMITLAGEGIELPIATDHNIQIDYEAAARAAGVRDRFTPIIGNEVTTPKIGHFNVFPIAAGAPVIDQNGPDWDAVARSIRSAPGAQVVVLNHARDLHGGFRPFGPKQHIGPAGENLDGWKLPANAMEVINSGATQTDPLQLFYDWFGLLNRGLSITPIGASDSHDVSRFIVGQGRTYIRADDRDPSRIDVAAACRSLREGRVMVSLGLLAELEVEGRFVPGDLASVEGDIEVRVRVLGPGWIMARHVALYMNGVIVREGDIPADTGTRPGLKFEMLWSLPRPPHDVHLAVIADGPGVTAPIWPIAKSYQPTSPKWRPYVLGASGVVRVDADGSGDFTSAFGYASGLVERAAGDLAKVLKALEPFDEAVAIQAASLLRARGVDLLSDETTARLREAPPEARRGFDEYIRHWKASLVARSMP